VLVGVGFFGVGFLVCGFFFFFFFVKDLFIRDHKNLVFERAFFQFSFLFCVLSGVVSPTRGDGPIGVCTD